MASRSPTRSSWSGASGGAASWSSRIHGRSVPCGNQPVHRVPSSRRRIDGVVVDVIILRRFDALKAAGRTHSTLVHASPMCETESEVPMSPLPFTSARTNPEPGAPHGAVPVPCVSLTDILLKAGHRRIDFFSLDVENSEDRVLETLDFKKVDVALVFAESYNDKCRRRCAKRDRVREYMAAAGYALNPAGVNVHYSDVFLREDLMGAAEARRLLRAVVV